jgi:hypothetical protein
MEMFLNFISFQNLMRFMTSLTFGLIGIGLVMKVLLDRVFHEWDAVADGVALAKRVWRGRSMTTHLRAEDILMEAERSRSESKPASSRLIDQRREQLNAMREVEIRLNAPVSAAPAAEAPSPK